MSESLEEALLDNCNIREHDSDGVTIIDLPNEVLDHIFSFLTIKERIRTERVCRSWAVFGKTYKWSWPSKLDSNMLSNSLQTDSDRISLSVLLRCGTSLKKLILEVNNPPMGVTFRTCHVVGANCPNLTSIKLFILYPVSDPDAIISITRGCTKLKKISIRMFSIYWTRRINNEDTANVCLALKECRSLEYLDLTCSSSIIEERCLDEIGETLKGLRIELMEETKFSIIASKLLQRTDPIEKLVFHWLEDNVQDRLMKVVHHYENTLRKLNLSSCKMSSSYWCKIPVKLKHLEVLALAASSVVDDNFLRVLADSCKKLRELDISYTNVTEVGVSYLTVLPALTVFAVSTAKTGHGLLSLASFGRLEKVSCRNLRYHDPSIEESCIALAKNCPNLHFLDASDHDNVTNRLVDEICALLQHGSLKGPVSLHLRQTKVNKNLEGWDNLHLYI